MKAWRVTLLALSIFLSVTQHTWTAGFMFGVLLTAVTFDVIELTTRRRS